MALFGKQLGVIWSEFAQENGGEFVEGSLIKTPKIKLSYKKCQIQIETYRVQTGSVSQTYTRVLVPFVRHGGLEFRISRAGLFSEFGKAMGMQDIEIGESEFDKAFKIKGNDEKVISQILFYGELRTMLNELDSVHLEIKRNLGAFGPHFKDDEAVLLYHSNRTIKDKEVLSKVVVLMKKMIDILMEKGILIDDFAHVDLS